MPPNEGPEYDDTCVSPEWSPPTTPLQIPSPPSEPNYPETNYYEYFNQTLPTVDFSPTITLYGRIHVPIEQNLRDILIKVTDTENLSEVTKVKLKVIAREISLQHLSTHTPNLTELNLDGSIVSSLRDLGCGLTKLKILRISRCGLTSFDGLFGLQTLEELHAADNHLENLYQCTSLPELKVLDVRRNHLQNVSAVSFLSLCEKLEHLMLQGNYNICSDINYKNSVKRILPNLRILDDEYFSVYGDTSSTGDDSSSDDVEDSESSEIIEDKDGSLKEIQPVSLEGRPSSSRPASVLPPINPSSATTKKRPTTASPPGLLTNAREISSPTTSERVSLPTIADGRRLTSPSSLTSGAPICGNVVAALRSRLRQQEAWREE